MKMNRLRASDYIRGLAESGRYSFTSNEVRKGLGVSVAAARLALNQLIRAGEVASPAIVPRCVAYESVVSGSVGLCAAPPRIALFVTK